MKTQLNIRIETSPRWDDLFSIFVTKDGYEHETSVIGERAMLKAIQHIVELAIEQANESLEEEVAA